MRTIRFNNNRHISSSPLLRTEGGREASVSNTSGDKIPKGKVSFFLLFFLLFLGSCSSDFLDNKPTDAVDSGLVPVPSNAERIFNGAWYNLFEYGTTYANIGYRALMCLDDMMADDVVSRPMYGFNSSYQFNDVVMPSDGRTTFAWYLMYKTIDNLIRPFLSRLPETMIHLSSGMPRDRHLPYVLSVIFIWHSIISSPI